MRVPSLALVAAIAAAIIGSSCATTMPLSPPVVTPTGVRFVLIRPDAHNVAVAGTFNQWSASSHPLSRGGKGTWSLVVRLPPGEHLFMYVVDGMFMSPPLADDFVDDGFGAKNGVVSVPPVER